MVENLPRGWRLVAAGALGTWHGGGTPSKGRSDYPTNGTVPWCSPEGMRADVTTTTARITDDDLDNAPFIERGGIDGAVRDLGADAGTYLRQLNTEVTA